MLSDAQAHHNAGHPLAGKIGFNSPAGVSGTNIFANQLAGGAVIQLTHGTSIYSAFNAFKTEPLANHRLTSAPSGLSITTAWADNNENVCDGCLRLTLAWTGTNRNVTSDTTVGIDVKGRVFQSSPLNSAANRDTWYTIGSFTIKPTAKGLELSAPTNSATVTEAGSQSTFTVKLAAVPSANVTVAISSGDTTEGTVSPSTMTFTTQNWSTVQTVTVTGVDDSVRDGNVNWNVVLNPSSTDTGYNALSNVNAAMTTSDDEERPSFSIADASVVEGDSGSTNMVFTVTMSPAHSLNRVVSYTTSNGTATAGSSGDYTAVTAGDLTIAAGSTSGTFNVSVRGDTLDEANETFTVRLHNADADTNIAAAGDSATGTILDDDPKFSIDSPSVVEGDSGSKDMTFTVTLSAMSTSSLTVSYAQTGGTATSGTDYTAVTGGMLTFAAGTTSQTITVSVRGDTADEGASETVVLTLSGATSGAGIGTASGTGTITDDDPKFSIADASVAEGDSSTVNMTFTVTLSATTATQTTVSYATSNGTATTAGSDYTARTGTLTFAAGTTNLSQTFTVSVTGDTTDEGAGETFTVTLSSATGGAGIDDGTATGTITDDDPKFLIADASVAEGDSSSVNMTFTVTLSASTTTQTTVSYATSAGTATSGTDYTAVTAGMLTFAAGDTSKTFTVSVTGDTTDEGASETFTVTLSNATGGAGIADGTATGTITDDDPKFLIADASVAEGDSSSVNMTFTVTLSATTATQTTVSYATSNGTATTAGSDYTARTGTLTFAAGTTNLSQTFTVSVTGDTTDEGASETFTVALSNATGGAGIDDGTATGTILDDDPKFSIADASVAEGDSGSANLRFTVTLSASTTTQTTVSYATSAGTATSGTDYTAVTAGMLTFAAGTTSRTITVSVTGDATNEGASETFTVMLSNATGGAGIDDGTATGTITDDDPKFSINSPSVVEGDSSTTNLVFTVTLSAASTSPLTVDYARTGGTATSGTDYTAVSSGTLTFAANSTSETITVSVTGDTVDEGNETVVITLSNATGGSGISTATGTGTITDDDPKFSIDSPTVTEADSNSVNLVFTVTLSASSSSQLTVDYASSDGSTNGATAGTDYTAVSGTLTFLAGTTSRTITVSVTGDTANELNETVVVTLSDATSGAGIATATGTGTITDNDTPNFSINSPSVAEGNSGSANLVFTVTLSPASATQVTVNYADAGTGTATSGTDYTALSASNTLTFTAGTTTQTITVSVTGDTSHEADETVVLTLSNASTGTNISTASGTGTITNDDSGLAIDSPSVTEGDSGSANLVFTVTLDPASASQVTVNYARTGGTGTITDNDVPGFSIDSPNVMEGDSGSTSLTFTVSLSPASHQPATVNYADAGSGTATSGTDYETLAGGTLRFAAGETSKTIAVSVTGDAEFEPDETVVIVLSNATSDASISTASGTGTIANDDDTPVFSIDSPSVEEGDTDSVNLTFTVTLTPASFEQATVNYADTGTGTAEAGVDYRSIAGGTLTFAAGETSKTIDVSVIGDVLSEQDETVVLVLSDPNPSYTIEEARGTGTIADNDASVLDEVDTEIVAEVAREVTTSVVTAVGNRIASVVGGAAIAPPVGLPPVSVPPTGGFADGGLLSILERSARHSRERERGLERSEMSLYRSLDGASFVYTPSLAALGANGSADASGGMLAGAPTVWGSVDYRKLSGGGADALQWDGELASVNIGTDTMVDAGVLVGLAAGVSKGSFGYQGSTGGTSGVVKVRVKSLNPYIGWSVSESASLWAAVGYGKGKVNYNDGATGEAASKMSIASAALGGRYRLHSNDAALCSCLIQVDLKGEAWGLQTRVDGDERRPMGSKSRAHGVRVAIERLQSSALESGASLTLSGEAGLRWDGGDGDTGTGIEMGGTAEYRNPATRMKLVATGRALLDHESDRKEWGAGLTAGYRLDSRETGLTYSSSLSHGQPESGVDSLWDSRVASRTSEDKELTTRLDAEVGYRMFGTSGLHTPYVGIGVEEGSKRDYRIGMRYASESELSSGLEFERREADGKQPDHRVMLTGQTDW